MNTVEFVKEGDGRVRFRGAVLALSLVGLAVAFSSCSGTRTQGQAPQAMRMPPVPVMVASARQETVPIVLTQIGTVEAYSTVTIRSQVDGQLKTVNFTEGQDVKAGDLLFTIDSRSHEAALAQDEANLAHDQAQYENAKAQDGRYAALFQAGIVSKDQYEQYHSAASALEATVKADRAAIENAKVTLGYCTIRSPISGRTGSLQVNAGNMLKANDTALVVVNQISPIYVDLSVPQQNLAEIKERLSRERLRVTAAIPAGSEEKTESGSLSFVNNAVDSNTGTIMLKATFENRQHRLWPGQFVNVTLELSRQADAVLVPTQAVQTGQNAHYVFLVKPDQTVEVRPVVAGNTYGGDTVIQQGVQPGDRVVTDGQLRLFPGAKIVIKTGLAPAAATGA